MPDRAEQNERTRIAINDVVFLLADGQSVEEMKAEIAAAVRAGGGFVDFVVAGGGSVSVLVSASSHVVIAAEPAGGDPRDGDDDSAPYGGTFDML